MNYPLSDPSWDYHETYESLCCVSQEIQRLIERMSAEKTQSPDVNREIPLALSDAIHHLSIVRQAYAPYLKAEEEFSIVLPTCLKIGDRVLNPLLITAIDFQSIDDNEERCTEVGFGDSSAYFYGEEAEILKRFFLSGSKVYDLNNLFG